LLVAYTGNIYRSVTAGITAVNPGVQGDGVLTTDINQISTVGTDYDAVTLPTAVAGSIIEVINSGANILEVFPNTDDNLGNGVNTATSIFPGGKTIFSAYDVTNWKTVSLPGPDVIIVAKSGGNYLTISAALATCSGGETILVYPGTYTETMTMPANNITVIGMGNPGSIIVTQADAAIVDYNTRTGIWIENMTLSVTAATTAIFTVSGSSGTITLNNCILAMTSATALEQIAQPGIGTVSGAGSLLMKDGSFTYAHTGVCGGSAQKGAFVVGTGGLIELDRVINSTIVNSGTAFTSATCIDLASTGNFTMNHCEISVTDPNATTVMGLGYVSGTGINNEFNKNIIEVTATANIGYGLFAADAASVTRTSLNCIKVVDTGGTSYSIYIGAGATVHSKFDNLISDDGVNNLGTFTQVNSQADGDLTVSGAITATGTITGNTSVTLDTDPTIVLTAAMCRNCARFNNDADAIDYTLPGAAAGLVVLFYDIGGGVITVDPVDGTDTIYLNGTSVGAGDAIDSPGAVGDFICLMAIDDTRWVTIGRSGTWVDGGVD